MDSQSKKAGRRPGQSTTKGKIAEAARGLFASDGYDQTTIRAVAAKAGVDPALVIHYFGTKQELFIAVMVPAQNAPQKLAAALKGDRETAGLRLAMLFVGLMDREPTSQIMLGAVRAAIQIPGGVTLLRSVVVRPILQVFKSQSGLDQPELRATLCQSQLVGLVMARHILKIEPLASASREELIAYIAPTLQRYLTADLTTPAPPAAPPPPKA